MSRIFLTSDPALLSCTELGFSIGAPCAVAPGYAAPLGMVAVPWSEFATAPRRYITSEGVAVVGITRVMTPATRTAEVFEVLFNRTPEVRKVSVDRWLFVGEPWRAWFPFGLVGAQTGDYTYSYIAESHYRQHDEGMQPDDPFSFDVLMGWARGEVVARSAPLFGAPEIEVVAVSVEDREAYAVEKERAFVEETTAKAIVRRLGAFAKARCPRRSVPSFAGMFRKGVLRVVRTDLKVDEYVVGELVRVAALHDAIVRVLG